MEVLLVLLFVALTEKDPELKARLASALEFYRTHRELLRALAEPPRGDEKGSPPAREESLKLLESFLNGV